MKKEDLIAENGKMRQQLQDVLNLDGAQRKSLGKALNLLAQPGSYRSDGEIPDWSEIFVAIGRLKAAQTFYDIQNDVRANAEQIYQLKRQLEND